MIPTARIFTRNPTDGSFSPLPLCPEHSALLSAHASTPHNPSSSPNIAPDFADLVHTPLFRHYFPQFFPQAGAAPKPVRVLVSEETIFVTEMDDPNFERSQSISFHEIWDQLGAHNPSQSEQEELRRDIGTMHGIQRTIIQKAQCVYDRCQHHLCHPHAHTVSPITSPINATPILLPPSMQSPPSAMDPTAEIARLTQLLEDSQTAQHLADARFQALAQEHQALRTCYQEQAAAHTQERERLHQELALRQSEHTAAQQRTEEAAFREQQRLRDQLGELQQALAQSEQERQVALEATASTEQHNHSLADRVQQLETALDRQAHELSTSREERNSLLRRCAEQETALQERLRELEACQRELDTNQTRCMALEQQAQERTDVLLRVTEELAQARLSATSASEEAQNRIEALIAQQQRLGQEKEGIARELRELRIEQGERQRMLTRLETTNLQLIEENRQLTAKLSQAQERIAHLETIIQGKEAELRIAQRKEQESQKALHRLERQQAALQERFDRTDQALRDKHRHAADLNERLNTLTSQLRGAKEREQQEITACAKLHEELLAAQRAIDQLTRDKEALGTTLADTQREKGQALDECAALSTERRQLLAAMAELEETEFQALRELEALRQEFTETTFRLETTIASLKETTVAQQGAIHAYECQIDSFSDACNRQVRRAEELSSEIDRAYVQIEALERRIDSLTAERDALRQTSLELERKALEASDVSAATQRELEEYTQRNVELTQTLERAKREQAGLKEKVRALEHANLRLHHTNEELSRHLSRTEERVGQLQTIITGKEAEVRIAQRQAAAVEKTLKALQEEHSQLRTEIDKAQQALSAKQREAQTLHQQLQDARTTQRETHSRCATLEGQLHEATQAVERTEKELHALRKESLEKEGAVAQITRAHQEAIQNQDTITSALDTLRAQYATTLEEELTLHTLMQQRLEEASSIIKELQARSEHTEAQLLHVQTAQTATLEQLAQTQRDLESLTQEKEEISSAFAERTTALASLEKAHGQLSQQQETLTQQLSEMAEERGRSGATLQELREALALVEQERNRATSQVAQLEEGASLHERALADLRSTLLEALEGEAIRYEDLQQAMDEASTYIAQVEAELAALSQKLAISEFCKGRSMQDCQQLDKEYQRVKKESHEVHSELRTTQATVRTQNQDLRRIRSELAEARQEIQTLHTRLKPSDEEQNYEQLKGMLGACERLFADKFQETETMLDSIGTLLSSAIAECLEQKHQAQTQTRELYTAQHALDDERMRISMERQDLLEQMAHLEALESEHRRELQALHLQQEETETALHTLKEENSALTHTQNEQEAALREERSRIRVLSEQLQEAETLKTLLTTKYQASDAQLQQAIDTLESSQVQFSDEQAVILQLRQTIDSLEEKIQHLEERSTTVQAASRAYQRRLKELAVDQSTHAEQLENFRRLIQQKEEQSIHFQQEKEQAQRESAVLQERLLQLQAEAQQREEVLQHERAQKQAQLVQLSDALERATTEISQLYQEIRRVKEKKAHTDTSSVQRLERQERTQCIAWEQDARAALKTERDLHTAIAFGQQLVAKVTDLTQQLERALSENTILRVQLEKEVEDKERACINRSLDKEEYEAIAQSQELQYQEIVKRLNAAYLRIQELTTLLVASQSEERTLAEELEQMRSLHAAEMQLVESLDAALQEAGHEMQTARKERDYTNEENHELYRTIGRLKGALAQLECSLQIENEQRLVRISIDTQERQERASWERAAQQLATTAAQTQTLLSREQDERALYEEEEEHVRAILEEGRLIPPTLPLEETPPPPVEEVEEAPCVEAPISTSSEESEIEEGMQCLQAFVRERGKIPILVTDSEYQLFMANKMLLDQVQRITTNDNLSSSEEHTLEVELCDTPRSLQIVQSCTNPTPPPMTARHPRPLSTPRFETCTLTSLKSKTGGEKKGLEPSITQVERLYRSVVFQESPEAQETARESRRAKVLLSALSKVEQEVNRKKTKQGLNTLSTTYARTIDANCGTLANTCRHMVAFAEACRRNPQEQEHQRQLNTIFETHLLPCFKAMPAKDILAFRALHNVCHIAHRRRESGVNTLPDQDFLVKIGAFEKHFRDLCNLIELQLPPSRSG